MNGFVSVGLTHVRRKSINLLKQLAFLFLFSTLNNHIETDNDTIGTVKTSTLKRSYLLYVRKKLRCLQPLIISMCGKDAMKYTIPLYLVQAICCAIIALVTWCRHENGNSDRSVFFVCYFITYKKHDSNSNRLHMWPVPMCMLSTTR